MMKRLIMLIATLTVAFSVNAQTINYASLHDALIKFYGYQRAGLKTGSANNLNSGFTNASHNGDNWDASHPLDGGWYDAGDYIKFGMPLSYTVYCLLKGYDLFPSAYADNYKADHSAGADQIPDVLNQVKFATDYIMKAIIDENTIILDVGIAEEEHNAGMTRANNPGGRDKSKCRTCSGADIPCVYAACLALMSTVYKKHDAAYSKQCLDKAIVAFKFAKKKIDQGGDNNLYSSPQLKAGKALYDYYKPEGGAVQRQIGDKIAAAGIELYRASNDADPVYRQWAKKPIAANYNCMSYSFVGPLASIEVWRQGFAAGASSDVDFVDSKVATTGFFSGVYKNSGWGTARDAGTAAFVYALAYLTNGADAARTKYLQKAKDHVGFVSGYYGATTKRSYVIGFNGSPATNIHYRTASTGPQGGVISGPDDNGGWENDAKPEHCEVALDYNAGIIGAVAFLKALENPGTDIKVSTAFAATPTNEVNFTTTSVKFSATLSADVPWTITISGGTAVKKFTGTTKAVSATWDGAADDGLFLSGEAVTAKLTLEGSNIVAYDIIKAKAIGITIATAKKPAASPDDKLVDDFEDGNLTSSVNGTWIPFGSDSSFANKTTASVSTFNNSKILQISGTDLKDGESSYAGIKTTLDGSQCGAITNIVFDLKANKEVMVNVELEQPSITDGAYYSTLIPVTKMVNTYRLSVPKLKQAAWKQTDKPLDLATIKSLRFVVYDSIGLVSLSLDNVYIEKLGVGTTYAKRNFLQKTDLIPMISSAALSYTIPSGFAMPVECAIYDLTGKLVLKKSLAGTAGSTASVSLATFPSGVYYVNHSIGGKSLGEKVMFTKLK